MTRGRVVHVGALCALYEGRLARGRVAEGRLARCGLSLSNDESWSVGCFSPMGGGWSASCSSPSGGWS